MLTVYATVAPEYPRIEPFDYRAYAGSLPPIQNLQDVDVILYGEHIQTQSLFGLRSAQVLALHEKLYQGYDGGLQQPSDGWKDWISLASSLITVDESKWFGFYQKGAWLDLLTDPRKELRQPIPPLAAAEEPCYWSVDNKAVWDVLRISIELANRILNMLVDQEDDWFVRSYFLSFILLY